MKSNLARAAAVLIASALFAAGGYRLALPGYRFEFPRDHFNHPDFQTEWWYYTGNLLASDGHRFGFELTFFRQGASRAPQSGSPWNLDELYLAHLALSDISGRRFYHLSRLNRTGPGFAGADESSGRVWNGNWQAQWLLPPPKPFFTSQRLTAVSPDFSIGLDVRSAKPPVIHGRDGVSQKADGPGHASHYISFTRLDTAGSIDLHGKRYAVAGTSWMDHEFFTHQLQDSQTGWDWFSLQLDGGSELMLFRIRHKDGGADPHSAGTYIDPQGRALPLSHGDFALIPGRVWVSAETKAPYPVAWTIHILPLHLELEATTPLDSQELAASDSAAPSYWEGAIDLRGSRDGKPARGVGYLEMTGYGRAVKFGR